MNKVQKSLKRSAFLNMIRSIMTMIFPLISFPYASRVLLPEGIGKVNFANSIVDYFVIIADLGISTYATREASRVRDDATKLNKLSREIFVINMISMAVSYFIFAITLIFVSKFNDYKILLIVCASKILFSTISFGWIYTAEEEYEYITIRSILFQILSILFLFIFVHEPDDYLLYAGMGVFSSVGSNILNLIHSRKFINLFEKTKLEIKKHLKYIIILFGNKCASVINNTIDSIMLGFLLGDITVGLYTASIKITKIVISVVDNVIGTILPRSSYYLENNQIKRYKELLDKSFGVSLFFSIPITSGLFILSKPILLLFSGENFIDAFIPSRIITFMIIPIAGSYIINTSILIPSRKEKITLITQIIGMISNICFNCFFIPFYGLIGACVATVSVEYTIFITRLFFVWKKIPKKSCMVNLLQASVSSSIMLIIIMIETKYVSNLFSQLIICIFTGAISYFLCMLFFRNRTAILFFNILKKAKFLLNSR